MLNCDGLQPGSVVGVWLQQTLICSFVKAWVWSIMAKPLYVNPKMSRSVQLVHVNVTTFRSVPDGGWLKKNVIGVVKGLSLGLLGVYRGTSLIRDRTPPRIVHRSGSRDQHLMA